MKELFKYALDILSSDRLSIPADQASIMAETQALLRGLVSDDNQISLLPLQEADKHLSEKKSEHW